LYAYMSFSVDPPVVRLGVLSLSYIRVRKSHAMCHFPDFGYMYWYQYQKINTTQQHQNPGSVAHALQ
jgi:hypothetical protein